MRLSIGANIKEDFEPLAQIVLGYQPNPKLPGIRLGYKQAGTLPFAVSGAAPNGVLNVSGGNFYDENNNIVQYTSSTGGFSVSFVYEGVTDFEQQFEPYRTDNLVLDFFGEENLTTQSVNDMLSLLGGNEPWFSSSFMSVGIQTPIFNGLGFFVDYLILPSRKTIKNAFTNPNLEGISFSRRFNPSEVHKPLVFDLGINLFAGRLSIEAGARVQLFNANSEVMIHAGNTARIFDYRDSFGAYYGGVETVYGDGSVISPHLYQNSTSQYHIFEHTESLDDSSILERFFALHASKILPVYEPDISLRPYPFANLTYILF